MADVPEEMKTKGRPECPDFNDDEELYRRFPPDYVEGGSVAIEALELPDMSVNREKFGPAGWLLIGKTFADWGVLAFEVRHIPGELLHLGVTTYTFAPKHRPHKNSYPHSEVWAYCKGEHVDAKTTFLLDPDVHQRWRQQLLWNCRPVIQPQQA